MEDNGIRISGISARLNDSTYTPAKPKSPFFVFCITVIALLRESSYATLSPFSIGCRTVQLVPLGPVADTMADCYHSNGSLVSQLGSIRLYPPPVAQ